MRPERLAADYGLWVGSYVRGELPSMRAHAAAFLERRRGETRFARGRRRPSRRRDSHAGSPESIARREIISNGRSPCSNPAATTIWPFASDRTPASPRWPIWRLRRGLWAKSIARFRSSTAADADRAPHPCRHARVWKNARGHVRIDARRPRARRAERLRTRPTHARA